MVKKFTEVQLSRVLSHAHELIRFGTERRENFGEDDCRNVVGCINQAAYNIGDSQEAFDKNHDVGAAFDKQYVAKTPDRILRFLESLGAV